MTYDEALDAVKEGKYIRRPHWWPKAVVYWHPQFNRLWDSYGDRGWTPFDFDKKADDWEISS